MFCVEPGTALPSLVYYAQPHFDTLRTLGSTAESDYYYYRKSTVFLTDSASMVRLKPFLIRDSIPYTIIPIWIIDRQRTDSYMIFRSAPKPATNNQ